MSKGNTAVYAEIVCISHTLNSGENQLNTAQNHKLARKTAVQGDNGQNKYSTNLLNTA